MLGTVIFQCFYSATQACRRQLKSHFNIWAYEALNVDYQHIQKRISIMILGNNDGNGHLCGTLVNTLIHLLHCQNDDLQRMSSRLLFSMHKRENILFSNAAATYLVTWRSYDVFTDLLQLGSLSDADKLLVKMHQGKLGSHKPALLSKLNEIAASCILEDNPADPHACHQWIVYSTSELGRDTGGQLNVYALGLFQGCSTNYCAIS